MRTILKWVARILGILVGLVVLAVALVFIVSSARINASYADVTPPDIEIPDDSETLARGEHLVHNVVDCVGCHGPELAGEVMIDDPAFGLLASSNLTSGEGGVGGTFTDEDWLLAIRHGIDAQRKPLLFMPAHEIAQLSGEDTAAIIAYVKTVPPVDHVLPEDKVGPMARVLFLTGELPLVPAELIDHDAPVPGAVEPAVTADYGEYLTVVCSGCHRETFNGGPITGAPPDAVPAANLTPHEEGLEGWSEEDFFRVLREGVGPDGEPVDEFMPWKAFRNMEDDEIRAIWLHLQELEPLPTGE